jgi:glycosyltransferase involved in cell wall biosynthesis
MSTLQAGDFFIMEIIDMGLSDTLLNKLPIKPEGLAYADMPHHKFVVMQTIDNLDIGGGQEVVHTLVKYLLSDECQPMVCTFKDGPLRQNIEQLGIKVEVLPQRRYSIIALPWFILDMLRIWRLLTGLIDKYKVDIIQTHLLRLFDFVVLPLLYTSRVRIVLWTFHSANFELTAANLPKYKRLLAAKNYSFRFLYRLAANLVSGFVAVSDEVKNSMVRVIGPIGDKVTVICNGVDAKRYEGAVDRAIVRRQLRLEPEACLIIVLATLKEPKGHRYLVEAMVPLTQRYPNLHALFVGDGPLRETLEAQVAKLNLSQHIHFLGNRHDVPELLAASDLFVLPSLWEGLAMALLEGMAAGLPIVASEVSGTVQVLTPNETGLLVPPGDTQRLVEAIEQLLSNPVQALAMGMAARRRVLQEFSAQKQAEEYLALYRRLLQSNS